MSRELPPQYNPKDVEEKIYKLWEKSGFFNPDKLPTNYKLPARGEARQRRQATNYSIVVPPPNITGSLHMGHALNATIQDILIRKKRMEGYRTLWLPGTDHAGIATQNVVEKELKKQGLSRHDIGREKLLEKIWEWKEKYGNIILDQFKKLGASLDWSRTRFTMDSKYQEAVAEAFVHYYKKGWIYRGERAVNWCPRCATSLSDLEIEYREEDAEWYEIKYGPLIIGTVRPETKLGDTAVAVNPKDGRYKKYIGKELEIDTVLGPAKVKVIADPEVDMEFGTGVMKVTPAHDLHDFELAEKYGLEKRQVIGPDGRMTKLAEKYAGLKTAEARKQIVHDLEANGLLVSRSPYHHKVAVCYRCNTVLEPILSTQWFLKMDELAKKAISAVKSGKVRFHPKRWEKMYFEWLKNIHPVRSQTSQMSADAPKAHRTSNGVKDWCISRQIWWGHRIPIWYCVGGHLKTDKKMGFAGDMVPQVFVNKTRAYRLRDHGFRKGDRVAFENSATGEIFGHAIITEVKKTTIGEIGLKDPKHYKTYNTREEFIAAFKRHPQSIDKETINERTPTWLYTYRFEPINRSGPCIRLNPKMKGNWFFIRHGETDFNKIHKIQGQTAGAPLNELGKRQAYETASLLKPYKIDLIISSDLARAKETAEIIGKELGVEVLFDAALRERSYGVLEGVVRDEIQEKGLDEIFKNLEKYEYAPPEGENHSATEERIYAALARHHTVHKHKNIVIISHGSVLHGLLRKLKNIPFQQFRDVQIHNAEVIHFSVADPCKKCGGEFVEQDTNILDTWFSSSLWPFATLRWPEAYAEVRSEKPEVGSKCKPLLGSDLERFYPTSVLSTARDIINLWVARMVFSGMEFMKKPPFRDVVIHATILTKEGKRMSKSLGTGVDPMDLIEKYGADATRFGLIWQAMGNQDIHWSEEHVVAGKKFANKIWNASRFVLLQNQNSPPPLRLGWTSKFQTKADKIILKQLEKTKKEVNKRLEKYEFGQALHMLYDFFWHDFCDVYLEESKLQTTRLARARAERANYKLQTTTNRILLHVLSESLKMLHPFMPFVTEEIWSRLPIENKKMLIVESWPS